MKSDISPLFFLFISVVYDGEEAIQSISACNDPVNFFFFLVKPLHFGKAGCFLPFLWAAKGMVG